MPQSRNTGTTAAFDPDQNKVLWFFKINLFLVVAALTIYFKVFGFTITGYLWSIMFVYSIYTILRNRRNQFPILWWIPLMLYFGVYLAIDFSFIGMQSTFQYICPLLAGIAASGFTYTDQSLKRIVLYFKRFGLFLIFLLIVVSYIRFGEAGIGSGVNVIVCVIVAVLILSDYWVNGNKSNLAIYALLVLIPYFSITRMGITMILVILSLNFFKISLPTRTILLGFTLVAGIIVFNSSSFQKKSFFSGSGELKDISYDNPDFYSGGRTMLYALLDKGIDASPVWGNGPRSELLLFREEGLELQESHNDYKAIRYGYGWVGLSLLILGFMGTFISLYRQKRQITDKYRWIFWSAGLTLFIPMFGFMSTDNILKYTIFYGTLHFAFMAICFAKFKRPEPVKET